MKKKYLPSGSGTLAPFTLVHVLHAIMKNKMYRPALAGLVKGFIPQPLPGQGRVLGAGRAAISPTGVECHCDTPVRPNIRYKSILPAGSVLRWRRSCWQQVERKTRVRIRQGICVDPCTVPVDGLSQGTCPRDLHCHRAVKMKAPAQLL